MPLTAAILRVGLAAVAWLQVAGSLHIGRAESAGQALLIVLFYAAAIAMLVGWHGRIASAVTGITLMLIYHRLGPVDGHLARHQTWLLASSITWLALAPCSDMLSVDRVRGEAPSAQSSSRGGHRSGLLLIRIQVSAVYFFGALHKVTPGFISGERLQHIAAEHWFGSDVPTTLAPVFAIVALATIVLEIALAAGLWFSRTRTFLVPLGIAMHVAFAILLPVQTFSALMVLLYLAFMPPSEVERRLRQAVRREPPNTCVAASSHAAVSGALRSRRLREKRVTAVRLSPREAQL